MNSNTRPWVLLAASVIVSFCFWYWATKILAPAYGMRVVAGKRPVGNNSDLYPRWLGARELLLRGRNPYSAEITREIQSGFYGRPLDPHNPTDPAARESFVYPVYVVFLLAPTLNWPFPTVIEVFRWILLASIACSVPLWMYALKIRSLWPVVTAASLLALASFPAVEEYFQQNLTALAIFLLAAAAASARHNWLILGGFLLALATVKPDTAAVVVFWFVLWAAADWKQRSRLLWSFGISMIALLVSSEFLSPGWIPRFLNAVREYPNYGGDPTILRILLPAWLADLSAGLLIISLLVVCWQRRKAAIGSEDFGWALAWVVAVTLVILPKLAAYNQLLLIPALLVLARRYKDRAHTTFLARAMISGAFACQIWQWLTATILTIASLLLSAALIQTIAEVPLYTLLALSLGVLLAVILAASPRKSFVPGKTAPRVVKSFS